MAKQHEVVGRLRAFQRWRRGGNGAQPDPKQIGADLDWAIRVCEAADKMVNAKGRCPAEQSYQHLEGAVNS